MIKVYYYIFLELSYNNWIKSIKESIIINHIKQHSKSNSTYKYDRRIRIYIIILELLQKTMANNENDYYNYWWSVLSYKIEYPDKTFLLIGNDLSLLSIKLSKRYKSSTVISLKSPLDNFIPHYKLIKLLDVYL